MTFLDVFISGINNRNITLQTGVYHFSSNQNQLKDKSDVH